MSLPCLKNILARFQPSLPAAMLFLDLFVKAKQLLKKGKVKFYVKQQRLKQLYEARFHLKQSCNRLWSPKSTLAEELCFLILKITF